MSKLKLFFKENYPVEVIGTDTMVLEMRDEVRHGIQSGCSDIDKYPHLKSVINQLPEAPCKYKYEKVS